jgi:hypothetical protein
MSALADNDASRVFKTSANFSEAPDGAERSGGVESLIDLKIQQQHQNKYIAGSVIVRSSI